MLTDTAVRKAKAGDKAYKLADSGGLHLFVTPAGGKLWRFRYSYGGKEKLLSIGPYDVVGLVEARAARDAAKATLRDGRDPGVVKKLRKLSHVTSSANTFEAIAREWHELNKSQWVRRHADDVIGSLEREVFPKLGSVPVTDIRAQEVIALLREVEKHAKETARRIRQRMSAVFVYAISTGRGEDDPAAIVQSAMAPMVKGRFPAITDLGQAREMLAKAEAEKAHPVTKLALRILALTAARPGTLTTTPWSEWSDMGDNVWRIPAERMKLRLQYKDDDARDHWIPLSRQALEAIEVLRTMTGRGPIAFPNTRHAHKAMSENAIGYLLNRAGYHHRHVPHGWRSTFSTVMNEAHPLEFRVIDLMLAHKNRNKDKTEGAYNRAEFLDRRREIAQEWADLILEGARPAADLLVGPRK
jgi:integrase